MKHLLPTLTCLILAGCSGPSRQVTDRAATFDWRDLFNGQNLDGWVVENGANFSVRSGVIFVDKGTGWLRSEDEFGDAVLRLDFRFLEPEANSGVFVRTGSTSENDENGWPDNGYQVQCMDTLEGMRPLATMIPYGAEGFTDADHQSDLESIRKAYRGVGKWNTFEIACAGEELSVKLNGTQVTRARNVKNRRGHVGIQAEHGRLEFRNVRIRELP